MPRFAANLSFLFTELPFLDRFAAAADAGFSAVEFMFPYDWPAEDLTARLDRHNLKLVLFNAAQGDWAAGERGIAALPGRDAQFEAALGLALDYAAALGTRLIHVMAGLDGHGADRATFIANLQRASDAAARTEVTLLIEPINTRDMPGYFLNRTRQALDILREVDRANVGLQFDLYHRAIMDGDVAKGLYEVRDAVRHMQIANPPDRGEPDQCNLDYRSLFDLIDASGYSGHIGLEYKPRNGTVAGLAWAEQLGVRLG
jgi:2-dehydrotetronate isomerase